jgi:hypothetical protein
MNISKWVILLCFVLAAFWGRSAHAELVCDGSSIPSGWVIVNINSNVNNPCAPNRQFQITALTSAMNTFGPVCTNSGLPSDWVFTENVSSGQCAPFKSLTISRAIFDVGTMCDFTPQPPGYAITQIDTSSSCSPQRRFVIQKLRADISSLATVCTNTNLPSDWAFTYHNTGNQCAPYLTYKADRINFDSGLVCDLKLPDGYLVTLIQPSNFCDPQRQFSIVRASSHMGQTLIVCTNTPMPSGWIFMSNTSTGNCGPYLSMTARYADFAEGTMCELGNVPPGYVITGVQANSMCSPYRQLTIRRL